MSQPTPMTHARVPVMLSIAGSDPSGGAGVQADLKTASALGVYGAAALTSLTAQNTTGVQSIHTVPAAFVVDQVESVVQDLDVRAVKIGMLGTAEVVCAVAEVLNRYDVGTVVLDPVMVATSGDRLVDEDAVAAIRDVLLPYADLVTPNVQEAGILVGSSPPTDRDGLDATGRALRSVGVGAALVKGGHLGGDLSTDVLVDSEGVRAYSSTRVRTANTHGTGCTLSSAVASLLARGALLRDAVGGAKDYLDGALRAGAGRTVGSGNGPVDHLWQEGR